jgi:hypothetical protein
LRNTIFNINDIWNKNNKTSVENQTIINRLDDERNWISDCAKIKKNKNQKFFENKLISDENEKMNKS